MIGRATVIFGIILTSLAILFDIYPFVAGHADPNAIDLSMSSTPPCRVLSRGATTRMLYKQSRPGSREIWRSPR
jgi:hypothetical protein